MLISNVAQEHQFLPHYNATYFPSSLRPNPLNAPTSLRKNFPIFFKFSFKLALPSALSPSLPSPACCPGAGLPNRSTPSLTALTIALPKPSNLPTPKTGVLITLDALPKLPIPVPMCPDCICRGVSSGEFCTRFAWAGEARKAAKRSSSWA